MWERISVAIVVLVYLNWKVNSQTAESSPDRICDRGQANCGECLLTDPVCSWCADNITLSQQRCRVAGSVEDVCTAGFTFNPQGSFTPTLDVDFSEEATFDENSNTEDVIQLKPQAINVKLRQGRRQLVNITFRRVIDYPLDLYYVMDLSYSMRDDLLVLQELGSNLAEEIQSVTNNVRLGFGTFVDKVMMPYASTVPDQLQDPCLNIENATCDPVFGFRHQLSITPDGSKFRDAVSATRISGNIDQPEGGFDALMQIAVCREEIEWRDNALRVIVFTTDASSHIAMDGKLAAILEKNDMRCHLERGIHDFLPPDALVYSESKTMDYPSIGQLRQAFRDNNIRVIFAVTEDVEPLYADLPEIFDQQAFVETLNSNSDNVVDVIRRAYSALRGQIQLDPPKNIPDYVTLSYRVLCPGNEWKENSLSCSNVDIADQAVFQFELIATDCPSSPGQIDQINITSSSIVDKAVLSLEYVSCSCDCESEQEENSPSCSDAGTLQCGLCLCNPGASGDQCQCAASTTGLPLEQNCTTEIYAVGSDALLCNLQGTCDCGKCVCDEPFFGDYCECRNTGCPEECGGMEKGRCENCDGNQMCICNEDEGYTMNPDTKSCTCHEKECRRPNTTEPLCNNNGECDCDRCDCEPEFEGAFCQTCRHPRCTGLGGDCNGEELRRCAECVYEEDRAERVAATECQEHCQDKNILFSIRNELSDCSNCNGDDCIRCNSFSNDPDLHVPTECSDRSQQNGCDFTYKIFWNPFEKRFEIQVRKFDSERDCPAPVNPLFIVLPVIAGIVLLGLIALILWKIFQTMRDKKEYEQFIEETQKSDWSKGVNPLFTKPTDRIENPAFIGAN